LAERRTATDLYLKGGKLPSIVLIYILLALAAMIGALTPLIAAIRAPKNDLVDIVRALKKLEPRDNKRDDNDAKLPPLPRDERREHDTQQRPEGNDRISSTGDR
jgi:hypothetical protein